MSKHPQAQKFIVLEPNPQGPEAGHGPVVALDPPQPWGHIAIKVLMSGPVFVNNVTTLEAKNWQPSKEPVLVAAQRLWHLAKHCGMTEEAWGWLRQALPPNYAQPPVRELVAKTPLGQTSPAAPAPKRKAAKSSAKKPVEKVEPAPFAGGISEAEHQALAREVAIAAQIPARLLTPRPARRTKADTRDATPVPAQEAEPRETSVAGRIRQLLRAGKDDETTWSTVKAEFGLPEQSRTQIARVRRQMAGTGD